jgi:hypothetical protein
MATPRASAKNALVGMPIGYSQPQSRMKRTKSTAPPSRLTSTPTMTSAVRLRRKLDVWAR